MFLLYSKAIHTLNYYMNHMIYYLLQHYNMVLFVCVNIIICVHTYAHNTYCQGQINKVGPISGLKV